MKMLFDEKELIDRHQLKPHPEGGYFKENYRSEILMASRNLPNSFGGRRAMATSIVFFLPTGKFSTFHKLKQDEIWYFHAGSTLTIHSIDKDGVHNIYGLGDGVSEQSSPQVIIPAGTYFAAHANNGYALVGCMTTPGFDYADLDIPTASNLVKLFPQHEKLIRQLTRS